MTTYPNYPKPDRFSGVFDTQFDELVRHYGKSSVEAKGLLYSIAEFPGKPPFRDVLTEAVSFLRLVGTESQSPWEPNSDLRKTARQILIRRISTRLLDGIKITKEEMSIVHDVLRFFDDNDQHCPREGRDLQTLHQFLKRCWKIRKDLNQPLWSHLAEASINAGYLEQLDTEDMVLDYLYRHLLALLPKERKKMFTLPDSQMVEPFEDRGSGAISGGRIIYPPLPTDQVMKLCAWVLSKPFHKDKHEHAAKLLALHAQVELAKAV